MKSRKVLTVLFAFILFLIGVCCSMIFYKKKISKETFADELGVNLAEGKISKVIKLVRGRVTSKKNFFLEHFCTSSLPYYNRLG